MQEKKLVQKSWPFAEVTYELNESNELVVATKTAFKFVRVTNKITNINPSFYEYKNIAIKEIIWSFLLLAATLLLAWAGAESFDEKISYFCFSLFFLVITVVCINSAIKRSSHWYVFGDSKATRDVLFIFANNPSREESSNFVRLLSEVIKLSKAGVVEPDEDMSLMEQADNLFSSGAIDKSELSEIKLRIRNLLN